MIDKKLVKRLLKDGFTSRQIAKESGYPRAEVEKIVQEIRAVKKAARLKFLKVLALSLVFITPISYLVYEEFREPTDQEMYANMRQCADSLPQKQNGARSWLMSESPPQIGLDPKEFEFLEDSTKRLNQALERHKNIPEVRELHQQFGGHIFPTIFIKGVSRSLMRGKKEDILSRMTDPQALEAVFYARQDLYHPRIKRRPLFYDKEWGSLILAALNFADPTWFDALAVHEFWHAKRHRTKAPSATAPPFSGLWIKEELEAHGLEEKVLDHGTRGEYKRLVEQIASSIRAHSLRQFYARIPPEKFQRIDRLFKPEEQQEMDLRTGQYLFSLASLWLQGRYRADELERQRIEAYRLISSF